MQSPMTIKYYHADNGRLKDKLFMTSIEKNKQTISFTGVGAHHQNGVAEKRIEDFQRKATALLLHAQRRRPDAISIYLWPYALRAANDSRNSFPNKASLECPISRLSKTDRVPKMRNQHRMPCLCTKEGTARWKEGKEVDRQNQNRSVFGKLTKTCSKCIISIES
jgi:hypothetical protein